MKLPVKRNESGLFKEQRRDINELIDYCRSITVRGSKNLGVTVQHTSNGMLLKAEGVKAKPPGDIIRVLLIASGADEWTCRLNEGGTIQVAKPWTLRKTPFHGQTISYTDETGATYTVLYTYDATSTLKRTVSINGGATVETQVVIPRPKGNFDYIFAAPCAETGVTGTDYIDINADGRSWAKTD